MRGEVLHYDEAQGFGFISGADGNNYPFRREDMRRVVPIASGDSVEFELQGGQAKGVFPVRATTQTTSVPLVPQGQHSPAHFGRNAVVSAQPAATSLWSYFWRVLTVNFANFRGRARRKEYWGYFLFWTIAFVAACLAGVAIDDASGHFDPQSYVPVATVVASGGFILITLIPGIALTVRRMHDIGLSGWFYLVVFVPSVGSLVLFVFSLIPSQTHDNKWGPVPEGIVIPPPYAPPPHLTPTSP